MGTWAAPDTNDRMQALERLMANPITPELFWAEGQSLIGDDGLSDMVSFAEKHNPKADIRPAIAATLELWTRWMPTSSWTKPWELGTRERALFLAEQFFDQSLVALVPGKGLPDTEIAAACQVAMVSDDESGEDDIPRNYQAERIMPGLYAVKDLQNGNIFRAECIFETVGICPESAAELDQTFFTDNSTPALN